MSDAMYQQRRDEELARQLQKEKEEQQRREEQARIEAERREYERRERERKEEEEKKIKQNLGQEAETKKDQ